RWREILTDWQTQNRITFIEIKNNLTDKNGKRHAHRYRVHLSRIAVNTLDSARADTVQWEGNRGIALQEAVKRTRDKLPDMPPRTHIGRKREPDAEMLNIKELKTALTLLRKVEARAGGVELKRSMYGNDEPYLLNPELLSDIQQIL